MASSLKTASRRGLVERFDSSIGNGTVLSPYGGKTYRTETEGMAALLPVLGKETTTIKTIAKIITSKTANKITITLLVFSSLFNLLL